MTEPPASDRRRDPHTLAAPWIEYADRTNYVAAAVMFLVAALAMVLEDQHHPANGNSETSPTDRLIRSVHSRGMLIATPEDPPALWI